LYFKRKAVSCIFEPHHAAHTTNVHLPLVGAIFDRSLQLRTIGWKVFTLNSTQSIF